ncbi:MAG: RNA methyltransferase [Candidatus Eremiobacteraeota bacterium]|nr:RNA methyltransferase [Candidatus Eremiobacteraeota bacterium]
MPQLLGTRNPRLGAVRALLGRKGRHAQQKFSFEGLTLLNEAWASGVPLESLYVTQIAYDSCPIIPQIEAAGTPTYVVDDRIFARISDLDTPSGILAIAPLRLLPLAEMFSDGARVLLLANLSDPGNAGTLVRSAEAFGIVRIIFGNLGVEPHHPKVVRSTMGSIFRAQLAIASLDSVQGAARDHQFALIGAAKDGKRLDRAQFPERSVFMLGHERRGLGEWSRICHWHVSIPMGGRVESLNAGVAGSILLYEASKRQGLDNN